ncbi:hypothetical protein [Paraburkholderia sp. SIMBA_054]|uniref:hypothetical protein n=1 Tax=Paraburkholderia sp. SIMBA_054 TaxID=3085795 RepID=UPI00397CBBE8
MKILGTAAVSIAILSSVDAHAFDPLEAPAAAIERLKTIDCSTQPDECRYFAAVEAASFVDACPVAFGHKFSELDHSADKELASLLDDWTALTPATLRAAVLSPQNKLRRYLAGKAIDYLSDLPSDDLGIECSRLGLIKHGDSPEDMSEILKLSKNFDGWHHPNSSAETKSTP